MSSVALEAGLDSTALDEAGESTCQACGSRGLTAFYEVDRVPAQTCVLLETADEAGEYPTGQILLALCEACGFIQNVRFDLGIVDYSKPTEESQAFSERFNEFAGDLADHLVTEHNLTGKRVFEPGCGKGDFLRLLLDRGIGSALGIDPGYLPNREAVDDSRVEYRRDRYDSSMTGLTGDLVLTRHLLEHVPNVLEFFTWLAESAGKTERSVLFTEVPDTRRVLNEGAFWDIYHEHCSYFTAGSLARTVRRAGMSIDALDYGYDDQYLLATSSLSSGGRIFDIEESPEELAATVRAFAGRASSEVFSWRSRIESVQESGQPVAIWGGGSKAVAFLATIGLDGVTVVDINPHKQGKWLPGAAVEVQHPEVLVDLGPKLVIPMNAIYRHEIERDLRAMGLNPAVVPA